MDAATIGAFLSLTIRDATALVEKMTSNQSWNEEHTQTCKKGGGMHQLKKLEDRISEKKEVMHINDSCMTCEVCGDTRHLGNNCPKTQEDVNYIINNNYRPQ
jgi:hypothetical protein